MGDSLLFFVLVLVVSSCVAFPTVRVLDLRSVVNRGSGVTPAQSYEYTHAAAAISGLWNRQLDAGVPPFFYTVTDTDSEWLAYCRKQWLASANFSNLKGIVPAVAAAVDHGVFTGYVLYDPSVPATSLVASTAAGVEGLLPLCYRPDDPSSLYSQLVKGGIIKAASDASIGGGTATAPLTLKLNLVGRFNGTASGSAKNDAYAFALQRYFPRNPHDTLAADGRYLAYYIDYYWVGVADDHHDIPYPQSTVANHDFFISHRGFFFDLDPWDKDAPNDDPHQHPGTDFSTLLSMLSASYTQHRGGSMSHVGGFPPWAFKYVNDAHPGVATEWQFAEVVTAYNGYMDADACCIGWMANAAFFQHFPLSRPVYAQNPVPTIASLQAKGYVDSSGHVTADRLFYSFYVGDYDSAAWLYSQLAARLRDTARGQVPLGWALNPNLMDRFPVIFDYLWNELGLTPNDRITTGDSGAGYVNPTQLLWPRKWSLLPSADATWIAHSKPYYKKFDINFTGFLINGAAGGMNSAAESMYCSLSPWGMTEQWYGDKPPHFACFGITPVFEESDLSENGKAAAKQIASQFVANKASFRVFRSVLQFPSFHLSVMKEAAALTGGKAIAVDPLELGLLAKLHAGL